MRDIYRLYLFLYVLSQYVSKIIKLKNKYLLKIGLNIQETLMSNSIFSSLRVFYYLTSCSKRDLQLTVPSYRYRYLNCV